MDTSEVYIKMCDCLEIQGQWKPDAHDYFVRRNKNHALVDPVLIHYKSYYIWLPKQDQIQKMILQDEDLKLQKIAKLFGNFSPFFCCTSSKKFNSFEQLWLAFYMYEKYGKKWNGDKWIESGEEQWHLI